MTVRRLFKQETVLTIIMITVTTILIIGATVAWFLGNRPVTIQNYFQQAGGIDGIDVKMAIVSDTTDSNTEVIDGVTYYTMNAINDNSKVIDIDLAKLTNIEEGKLGPGSYGTIKFKISTTSETEMKYIIRITPSITVVDGISETSTDGSISKAELLDLVQNHIKFYGVKTEKDADGNEVAANNVYQKIIPYYFETTSGDSLEDSSADETNADETTTEAEDTSDGTSTNTSNDMSGTTDIETTGLTGKVSVNSSTDEQFVTIYWYWPYEYTDIPGYGIKDYNSPIYNPWSTSTEENVDVIVYEGRYSSSLSEKERIEAYDWDDTKIGNYVSALNFHFEVSTYQ